MDTKFTSSSKDDNGKITLRLTQFDDNCIGDDVPRSLLRDDSIIIVTIQLKRKTVDVLFRPNRFNKNFEAVTAATNAWPKALRSPKVGKHVIYNVVGVMYA
jgi:hypothetical protein